MGTAARGNAAEAAVLSALIRRGYEVAIPFGDGHRYDLLLDLETVILRVQCKRAWPNQDCIVFNSRSTDHGKGRGSYTGLADIFGVYFPPNETVYLIPVDAATGFEGRFRLAPARNNQRKGVRFAADFAIDRWTLDSLREVAVEGQVGRELRLSLA